MLPVQAQFSEAHLQGLHPAGLAAFVRRAPWAQAGCPTDWRPPGVASAPRMCLWRCLRCRCLLLVQALCPSAPPSGGGLLPFPSWSPPPPPGPAPCSVAGAVARLAQLLIDADKMTLEAVAEARSTSYSFQQLLTKLYHYIGKC